MGGESVMSNLAASLTVIFLPDNICVYRLQRRSVPRVDIQSLASASTSPLLRFLHATFSLEMA